MASLQVDINLSANKPHHIFSEDQTISPVKKELAKHSAMSVDLALVRMQPIAPDTADEAVVSRKRASPIIPLRPFLLVAPLILLLAESLTAIFVPKLSLTRRLLLRPRKVVLLWLCIPMHTPCQRMVAAATTPMSVVLHRHEPPPWCWP